MWPHINFKKYLFFLFLVVKPRNKTKSGKCEVPLAPNGIIDVNLADDYTDFD